MLDRTRSADLAWAALRIVAGAMFCLHGVDKLFGWPGVNGEPAAWTQLWIGGVIELVTGALVAIGFFTRLAAFVASGMMAVAYFQYDWHLHLQNKAWLPHVNGGELAVMYCFVFLAIAARGAGRYAIDGD
jgi:putative oxidoreductase